MGTVPKRARLDIKLMALFLLVALVPLGLMGAIVFQEPDKSDRTESDQMNISTKEALETISAAIWMAPNGTADPSSDMLTTLNELRDPARTLRITVEMTDGAYLGYIGTFNGVLALWPNITDTMQAIAPFDYRERPWYIMAKERNETSWTKPYYDTRTGSQAVTCATPIYEGETLKGVGGMDVSLAPIRQDISSYPSGSPFLIDGDGVVIVRPETLPEEFLWDELLAEGSLLDSRSPALTSLVSKMTQGESGVSVVRLGKGDCRIAYAPLRSMGWSLGIVQTSGDNKFAAAKAAYYDEFFDRIKTQNEIVARSAAESFRSGEDQAAPLVPEDDATANPQTGRFLVLFVLAGIFAGAIGLAVGRRITHPIATVTEALRRVGRGDLDVEIDAESDDEIGDLAKAFMVMEEALLDRVGSLRDEDISREITRNLLPKKIPKVDGYEIEVLALSVGQRSGQFYDVFEADEERTGLVMGDVSGDGLSAALFMHLSRTLIDAACIAHPDPARALEKANHNISKNANSGMMITCFCGMLETDNQFLEYANAGHTPPFVVRSDGRVETLGGGGIALGTLEEIKLEPDRIEMAQGDVLVVYNDGVSAALDDADESFGTERLISLVRSYREYSAAYILDGIEEEIRQHIGEREQEDDLILMIVRRC